MTITETPIRRAARAKLMEYLRCQEAKFILDVTDRGVLTRSEALQLCADHRLHMAVQIEDELDRFEEFVREES